MASIQRTHTTTVGDDLDDLFDYDVNMNDVLREVDTNMDAPAVQKPTAATGSRDRDVGLGIDEEIKISKPRRPVAKLDESRYVNRSLIGHHWLRHSICLIMVDYFHRRGYLSCDG